MKILITGASGFIGSNLVDVLSRQSNVEVYAIVRKIQYWNFKNVTQIISNLNEQNFTNAFPNQIDVVLHLAQSENYRDFPEKAESIFNVNVQSTLKILNWSLKSKVKNFLFFSSGNVYKPINSLIAESDRLEAFSFYGSTKIMGEELCKSYANYFQINIIRPFGIYGPNQKNMFMQTIFSRLTSNSIITLAKGIGLKITPLFISDCIDFLLPIIFSVTNSGLAVYNLCGNQIVSVKDVALNLAEQHNLKPNFVIEEKEPMYLMGNNNKICSQFNVKQTVFLQEGLQLTFKN